MTPLAGKWTRRCLTGIIFLYQACGFAATGAPVFANMGKTHFPITTRSAQAQKFFDQGLALFYAFEWSESIRSFQEAVRLDPQCAMCHWGVAISLSYKSNEPIDHHEFQDGLAAITEAHSLTAHTTPKERALIHALSIRYRASHKNSAIHKKGTCCVPGGSLSKKYNLAYVNAMNRIAQQFPQDQDIQVLAAGGQFWLFGDMKESNPAIKKVIARLESVIKTDNEHTGAHHYYIHFIEALTHVERALVSAKYFTDTAYDSHHLMHMPSHIYFLLGRYHDATEANVRAIETFDRYQKLCVQQGFEPKYSNLYIHDLDFLRSAAVMEGRRQLALSAATQINTTLTDARLKSEPTLQWFTPISYYMNARFALWDELKKIPEPAAEYAYADGMWHYAHGLALLHDDALPAAEADLKSLIRIINKNPKIQGLESLEIARELLLSSQAYRRQQETACLAHLKNAWNRQVATRYHEPPDWYFPIAEALGDAYMKFGKPKLALKYYQMDLEHFPENGWALHGLATSLRELGRDADAVKIDARYQKAWANADIHQPISFFN